MIPNSSVKHFKAKILPEILTYSKHYPKKSTEIKPSQQAQSYFLKHSLPLINEHLTYQDEELALSLLNIVDTFKCQDDSETLSEAAFHVDMQIKYNINPSEQAAKNFESVQVYKQYRF